MAAVAHPRSLQVPSSIEYEAAEAARFLISISGPLTPSPGCRYSLRVESDEDLSRNAPPP